MALIVDLPDWRLQLSSTRGAAECSSFSCHESGAIPSFLAKAQEAREVAKADDLLSDVRGLQERALGILDKAEDAGDRRTALGAIREARGNLELLAKLLGELDERPVNVLLSPEWLNPEDRDSHRARTSLRGARSRPGSHRGQE
jgi:hypothetical protein